MELLTFVFQGEGTFVSEEATAKYPVEFKMQLAPDADPDLIDMAAETISMLIIQRNIATAAILGDN